MERDRTAAADRVRDQALRSGVHLGKDQAQADDESLVRLQHFHQQRREKSPREGDAARKLVVLVVSCFKLHMVSF